MALVHNLEGNQVTRIGVTGITAVTSANAQVIGVIGASSLTAGTIQFMVDASGSNSLTPLIWLSAATVASTGGGVSFLRIPFGPSGSGINIKYSNTSDPNLLLFWCPVGGP